VQRRLYKAGNRTYWHSHEKEFLINFTEPVTDAEYNGRK
jgi:hypothetical protein